MRFARSAVLGAAITAITLHACKQRDNAHSDLEGSKGAPKEQNKYVKLDAMDNAWDLADKFMKNNPPKGCQISHTKKSDGSIQLTAVDKTAEVASLTFTPTSSLKMSLLKVSKDQWTLTYQISKGLFFRLEHGGVDENRVTADLITVADGKNSVTCASSAASMWDLLDE